jgi:hypothetical protein
MTEHRHEADQRGTTAEAECPVCHRPLPPTDHRGGAPRRYCSPEHRWLAHSRRRAGIPLDREPINTPRRTSRRRALPDFAVYAGQTLDRAVARIERLMSDDRLDANVDAVAAALTMYLGHAVSACAQALAKLDHHQEDDSP